MKKERIWELDALRGLCILGMIVIHFLFDYALFSREAPRLPALFYFVKRYGHVLFVLLSGICATLAGRTLRRGVIVFACGLLVSYVTLFMDYILGFSELRIWFGILHMLGLCMMLYPLLRRLPFWALGILGLGFVLLGFWMEGLTVSQSFLFPIGLRSETLFLGSDYFPLFPGLGWFLLGAAMGKTVYRKKTSLLPRAPRDFFLLRFLCFVGRHSLEAYLLHQPVLFFAAYLLFG